MKCHPERIEGAVRLLTLVVCAALMSVAANLPPATSALDFSRMADHPVTPLDHLRNEARLARYAGDGARAAALQDSLLAIHPGDGFTLCEIAYVADDQGRLPQMSADLTARRMEEIPCGARLTEADIEYLLAVVEAERCRYRSALEHLDRALAQRPGWGWVLARRGSVKRALLLPSAECDADIQAALEQADPAPHALAGEASYTILGRIDPGVLPFIDRLAGIPWTAEVRDLMRADERLGQGDADASLCDSIWDQARARYGEVSRRFESDLSWYASNEMPAGEALEYLSRGEKQALWPGFWRDRRILLQDELGYSELADSLLEPDGRPHPFLLDTRIRLGFDDLPLDRISSEVERLLEYSLSLDNVDLALDFYEGCGSTERSRALKELAARENPAALLQRRLKEYLSSNPAMARSLFDSLQAIGATPNSFGFERIVLSEREGDSLAVEAALSQATPMYRNALLPAVAHAALSSGRPGRSIRLARRAMAASPASVVWTLRLLTNMQNCADPQLTQELLDRLSQKRAGHPAEALAAIVPLLKLRDGQGALTLIREQVDSPRLPAEAAAGLAYHADRLDDSGLADRLMERARSMAPECRYVQYIDALILSARGRNDAAVAILRPLAEMLPGSDVYRTALAQADPSSRAFERDAFASASENLAIFGQEFESTTWIAEAKKKAETIKGTDGVYLMQRNSYWLGAVNRFMHRYRHTVLILTQQGIDQAHPVRLSFDAGWGNPQMRMGRVIHPDGRITMVRDQDIMITGSTEEEDVGDTRDMVIPFPDLEVGAVIDLVIDYPEQEYFGHGLSFTHVFGDGWPIVTETLEIAVPDGLAARFQAGPAAPQSVETRATGATIHTWNCEDQPAFEWTDMAGWADLFPRRVTCSTYASWADAEGWLCDEYRQRTSPSADIRTRALELTRGKKTAEEQVEAILAEMSRSVHYIAIEIGRGTVVPRTAEEILARGYGDCKDMTTLLISLLAPLGIEAIPVLVSPRPHLPIDPDFPTSHLFKHAIAYLPGIRGGMYCDPTRGLTCLAPIAYDLGGETGLLLPPSGEPQAVILPRCRPEEQGYRTEMDLWPGDQKQARIVVRSCFHGALGEALRAGLSSADTAQAGGYVDRFVGYGLWSTCRRVSWTALPDSCDSFGVEAVYEDSSWVSEGRNTITLRYLTEVAGPFIVYPDPKDRELDVEVPFPYHGISIVRLHDGGGWAIGRKIASLSVNNPHCQGSIAFADKRRGNDSWLEITQRFRMSATNIPVAEYQAFYDDWMRFRTGLYQPYRYERLLDEESIRRLEEYVENHPMDYSFAIQAAIKILGNDTGGQGENGDRRRATAKRLLSASMASPTAGSYPCLLGSLVESTDGRYFAAESLLVEAVARNPNDMWTLQQLAIIREELGDEEGWIEMLNRLVVLFPNPNNEFDLIRALRGAGRNEEAIAAEERFTALHGETDSTSVPLARYYGFARRASCEDAKRALEELQGLVSEDFWTSISSNYYSNCNLWEEALAAYQKAWTKAPLNSRTCNNVAWGSAILGRDLDRAEELANAAVLLSDSPSGSRNTLGAVLARKGDWRKSREVFQECLADDDLPSTQVLNTFFIALCDWKLGRQEEAIAAIRELLQQERVEPGWRRRMEKALALAQNGEDITRSIFVYETEEQAAE
ncbi:MAG: DUF3857 domain-containing protein [Candidatus Eisenbacteria bacterium]|nr:DUF3857 domain-containing protein [Candidatus Eisenbacteria bacterium]